MDKKTLKRACAVGLLSASTLVNPAAHAAQGSVNVDVLLPTVLVMYYYSDIDLDLDAGALAGYLSVDDSPCAAGDYCDDQLEAGVQSVTTIGPTTTVTLTAPTDPYGGAPVVTFELENAVAVRALGCASYAADFDVSSASDAITDQADQPVANIDGQPCSMGLTTGDLAFDLDFDLLDPGAETVSATLDVTITGSP